jgi:hypothetical protein
MSMHSSNKTLAIAALVLSAAACGASHDDDHAEGTGGAGGGDGGVLAGVCQKQSQGTTPDGYLVILCEQGFAEAPAVRPPADTTSLVYAGLAPRSKQLVTRSGRIDLGAVATSLIDKERAGTDSSVQGDRYAYTVYEVTLGPNQEVEKAVPAIIVDDAVFLRPYLGVDFEGVVSKREGPGKYELQPSLPIRLKASTEVQRAGAGEHGFPTAVLVATISNAADSVTGAAGTTCLPSLASAGEQNPLSDRSSGRPELKLSRIPDMHGGFDDMMIFEWPLGGMDMGGGLYLDPWQLMQTESSTHFQGSAHGTPWTIPWLTVDVVKGGGKRCE